MGWIRRPPDSGTPRLILTDLLSVDVECYAGHRGEQTPRAIRMGERRVEVAAVLDQWLAPDHRYFKVIDAAHDIYILRHDIASGRWELTMYERGPVDG